MFQVTIILNQKSVRYRKFSIWRFRKIFVITHESQKKTHDISKYQILKDEIFMQIIAYLDKQTNFFEKHDYKISARRYRKHKSFIKVIEYINNKKKRSKNNLPTKKI